MQESFYKTGKTRDRPFSSEWAKDERVSIHKLVGFGGMLHRGNFESRVPYMAGNALDILQMSCFCEIFVVWNGCVR